MIKINVNKKKTIEFDVNVQGVQCEALTGRLSLFYEDIIYSFPASIEDGNTIKVVIPPLNEIISDIPHKYQADLKLEVVGQEQFMLPWTGSAFLEHPVKVEATMRGARKLVEEEEVKVEVDEIREEEADEKACPEGQQWCSIQKKCVTPPGKGREEVDEKKKWVTDCDYCGKITVVRSHGGGKGCEHCIKKGKGPKTWAGALMKAAKEPVKPRKKKKRSRLGEALTGEEEDKKRRKLKNKKLGKALGEALLEGKPYVVDFKNEKDLLEKISKQGGVDFGKNVPPEADKLVKKGFLKKTKSLYQVTPKGAKELGYK